MDGDAVVPGLGGTRQQQRTCCSTASKGCVLPAATSPVEADRSRQHQHAAARRLAAGRTNNRPSGASARRRCTCTSMAASRIEVIPPSHCRRRRWFAAQTAPVAPERGGLGCGRQAVKCCGRGTTSRTVPPVGAFALRGGSPIPGRGGRCPRRWVVLRHRSAECRPLRRRRAEGGAAGTCSASVVSSAVAPCCQR